MQQKFRDNLCLKAKLLQLQYKLLQIGIPIDCKFKLSVNCKYPKNTEPMFVDQLKTIQLNVEIEANAKTNA